MTTKKKATKKKAATKKATKKKAAAKKKTAKKGRPKGAANHAREHATAEPSRCPKCGSTNRGPYTQKQVQEWGGVHPITGQPVTHIIRRWTSCTDCGQHRIDRSYENKPRKN